MFKNLRIGVRLAGGFVIVVILLAVVAFIGISRLNQLNDEIEKVVGDRFPKTEQANNIADALNVMARALRNAVLVKHEEDVRKELDRALDQRKVIGGILDKLMASIKSEKGKDLLKKLTEARQAYIPLQDRFTELVRAGKKDEAIEMLVTSIRKVQGDYLQAVDDLVHYQADLMKESGKQAEAAYESARNLMIMLAAAAAALAAVIGLLVTRSITGPLAESVAAANRLAEGDLTVKIEADSKDETGQLKAAMQTMVAKLGHIIGEVRGSADALASASQQVSATAQSLSQASSEQAASVEETTASVEQMTSSINQNTENARITDNMAGKAAQEAAEGGESVKETVEAMKQIAGRIGIIDDIAYQTNLLALNAAIEAARAGEHGKGFAVVAAEVRKLAERSQVAAQEIGELAGSSVKMAEKAGKLLDEMVPTIRKTSDLVQEIASASAEQSAGVGQINGAMGQLNQATQQNASASEELAATAEEMGGQAEQLQQLMQFFRIDEGAVAHAQIRHIGARPAAHAGATAPKKPMLVKVAGGAPIEADFEKF